MRPLFGIALLALSASPEACGQASLTGFRWWPILVVCVVVGMLFGTGDASAAEEYVFQSVYGEQDGTIVRHNGARYFNRPLYGPNMPAMALAGDKPQIKLIDPEYCGGTMLLAYVRGGHAKWFHNFETLVTRFHPGWVEWELKDSAFSGVVVSLEAASAAGRHGLTVKARIQGAEAGDAVVWAFGGARPRTGSSLPNLIWDSDPVVLPAQTAHGFDAAHCKGNKVEVRNELFVVTPPASEGSDQAGTRSVTGRCSLPSSLMVADASAAADPVALRSQSAGELPLLCGQFEAKAAQDGAYWILYSEETAAARSPEFQMNVPSGDLRAAHAEALEHANALAKRVVVDTPDKALNTAVAFSCSAMDAAWYPPVYVHGAMAWNSRYPGWRALYGPTAYGWHDNVKADAAYFIGSQVKESPNTEPKADPASRLTVQAQDSRYYGKGRIMNDQALYNMQSVFFDMLIHAWRWTGDAELEAMLRPALELHLDWQRDCFDPDGNGVYESYINVWASDTVWYNGGETTQETAYAYTGHLAAAQLAGRAGDAEGQRRHLEYADRIRANMMAALWMPEKGYLAEYREALGDKRLHPDTCLYSIMLPIDASMLGPIEAAQALYYTEWGLERVRSPLGGERCWTSNWTPYAWSVREFYPGENWHLALSYFQTGLADAGWELLKGNYREWLYNNMVPGAQTHANCGVDFTDCSSMFCRLVVEGLFGYQPDLPNGLIRLRPQIPLDWEHASITTPDFALECQRGASSAKWHVSMKREAGIEFCLPVCADAVTKVEVDGTECPWQAEPGFGQTNIVVRVPQCKDSTLVVEWANGRPPAPAMHKDVDTGASVELRTSRGAITEVQDPSGALSAITLAGDRVLATVKGGAGHYLVLAKTRVGQLEQWQMFKLNVRDPEAEARNARSILPQPPCDALWAPVDMKPALNADVRAVYKQKYLTPRVQTCSAQMGTDGFAPWTFVCWQHTPPDIDLVNVPNLLNKDGRVITPQGVPFAWADSDRNIAFTTHYDNYPASVSVPVGESGRAAWFLVAGTTNPMQSNIPNAVLILRYADKAEDTLELVPPSNYWTLSDKLFTYRLDTDRYCLPKTPPPMVQLGNNCRAMVLNRVMRPGVALESVELKTLSQEVVVGLMGVTIMK